MTVGAFAMLLCVAVFVAVLLPDTLISHGQLRVTHRAVL